MCSRIMMRLSCTLRLWAHCGHTMREAQYQGEEFRANAEKQKNKDADNNNASIDSDGNTNACANRKALGSRLWCTNVVVLVRLCGRGGYRRLG